MKYKYAGISMTYLGKNDKEHSLETGKEYTLTLDKSDFKGNITVNIRGGGTLTYSIDLFKKVWRDV